MSNLLDTIDELVETIYNETGERPTVLAISLNLNNIILNELSDISDKDIVSINRWNGLSIQLVNTTENYLRLR